MNAKKSILIAALLSFLLAGLIAGFNFHVDPLCYYCESIDTQKATLNRHYQVAQMIFSHPEAEQIILGSSRGETTSPQWLEEKTGLKTLNLSIAGGGIISKKAFIKMALEKAHLKRVIWYADYFELTNSHGEDTILNTKALRAYSSRIFERSNSPLLEKLHDLQALIDHNTIEASLAALKHKPDSGPNQGAGSSIDFKLCQSPEFKGKETPESLRHEIELLYDSYSHGVLKAPQESQAWTAFYDLMNELKSHKVEVKIIVIPYNPVFLARLKSEYPGIYQAHLNWLQNLKKAEGSGVQVLNFLEGIPGDDGSPSYWNDGVHFTCKGAMEMLKRSL